MMLVSKTKMEWTTEMREYAIDSFPHLSQIENGIPLFWFNIHREIGFRLTKRGHEILHSIGYEFWRFPMAKQEIKPKDLIQMDQKIKDPWCFENMHILFYDEKMSTAMALCNNNVDTAINLVYS